jgi:hypothetical protein
MPNISFGRIIVPLAGTPIQLTSNLANPAQYRLIHALLIQPHPANTGRVYIGIGPTFVKSGAGQIAWLAVPGTNVSPAFSETVSYAPNAVEVTEIYIDVDNNGDSVIGSGIIA